MPVYNVTFVKKKTSHAQLTLVAKNKTLAIKEAYRHMRCKECNYDDEESTWITEDILSCDTLPDEND